MNNIVYANPVEVPFTVPTIYCVNSPPLYQQVLQLRKKVYGELFPAIKNVGNPDLFDFGARVWVTLDESRCVNSTSRLVLDSEAGLPSEAYLKNHVMHLRNAGAKLAEFGRFINFSSHHSSLISKHHYRHLFFEATHLQVDTVLIVAPQIKYSLYAEKFGAKLLCEDIHEDYGCGKAFALYAWNLNSVAKSFFEWIGLVNHCN